MGKQYETANRNEEINPCEKQFKPGKKNSAHMMVTDVQFGAGLQMFSNSNGFVINAPFDVPPYQWTMKKQADFTYITTLNLSRLV